MSSFLKFSVLRAQSLEEDWAYNPDLAYRNLTIQDKASFLLSQALIVNYLERLYDYRLSKLLKDMVSHIKYTYLPDLITGCNIAGIGSEEKEILSSTRYLFGDKEQTLYSNTVLRVLNRIYLTGENDNISYPLNIAPTFYTPYVSFLVSMSFGIQQPPDANIVKLCNFTQSNVSIPTFSIQTGRLLIDFDFVRPQYTLDIARLYAFTQKGLMPIQSIYGYLSGYNWSGMNFSGVTGVLAAQCLELDLNAIPKGSGMLGFYDIYKKTIGFEAPTDQSAQLAQSSELYSQRRRIIAFIIELRDRYGVVFDDPTLLTKYLNDKTEDAGKLRDFLVSTDPNEVSVEIYQAFKRSVYGKYEELDVLKRSTSPSLVNKKESDDDPDAPQDDSDPLDPKSTKPKKGRSDSKAAPKGNEVNEDAASGDDKGAGQDPASKKPTKTADTSKKQTDDEPDTKPIVESGSTDISDSHTEERPVPELPRLSDKRGIRLSLSTGESTDTVLYKIELEAFVDSLLANPPSHLSVQTLTALKFIKTRWLNLLSAQSSYDMISRMVRVPRTIKPKSN